MKYFQLLLGIILLAGLSSCVEIIDDLSLNLDGSGTFKYNVNLSSSKVKINSILALDSVDGKKVPSLDEIKSKVNSLREKLELEPGISNVSLNTDYNDYIFKLSCDFNSLSDLQSAIKSLVVEESNNRAIPELDHNWLLFNGTSLERSVPDITIAEAGRIKESDRIKLKEGTYTSITRFAKEIVKFDNSNARLSANKKAIMLRTDPYSLTLNPNLLDNVIYLVPTTE
jgi:hypothetical protein